MRNNLSKIHYILFYLEDNLVFILLISSLRMFMSSFVGETESEQLTGGIVKIVGFIDVFRTLRLLYKSWIAVAPSPFPPSI
jgi:hypothetical protein